MLLTPPIAPSIERTKKRMMSVERDETGRTIVCINNSSLDIIQTCKRKAQFALVRELISSSEGAATIFGSGIHKGLEVWYSTPRAERVAKEVQEASIAAFNEVTSVLETLPFDDKRHPANGERILRAYFKKYADDPYEVLLDAFGTPFVERDFQFVLFDSPELQIRFFGTIDIILKNTDTNTILICDHKTTSSLGKDFYIRVAPNFQYTGYVLGAREAFHVAADGFMVNGLQVAKTKADLARQITTRNEDDFAEFRLAVHYYTREYLACAEQKSFPMGSINACSQYGSCQYHPICSAPKALHEDLINGLFKQR